MSARPTIYLSNWSSHRTPGMYGPGVRYTIMGRPRHWERGAGTVNLLTPQGDEADLMARAVALRGTPEGEAAMRTYRDSLIAGWAVAVMKMRHPLLTAWSDREAFPVRDGDTLCCACSVAETRAGRCHRAWAAPFLDAAGWRVVLDGREWARGEGS